MRWRLPVLGLFLSVWLFGLSPSVAQEILISEFMASNSTTLADEDGAYSDWVELHNPGTAPVNLNGWHLTDSTSDMTKWTFPAVTLPAGGYLIVFTSDKDKRDPTKPLHAPWKLSASGEYLGLVRPNLTVACEYAPVFPPQQTDVSYGMAFGGSMTTLVRAGASATAIVPDSGALGLTWTLPNFDDSGWTPGTTGIGYERSSGYESLIGLDLGQSMYERYSSAYIRIPFTLDAIPNGSLSLWMRYDDGFVAYLNGTRLASANAPSSPAHDASATRIHEDYQAVQSEEFDATAALPALQVGKNVLAIHGLNAGNSSSDFLMLPELVGLSGEGVMSQVRRYFNVPTPGGPNGTAAGDKGPEIHEVTHSPARPTASQNLVVTARVNPVSSPLTSVTMRYRVHYGAEVTVAMADDGSHGDAGVGDGIYGATIPESAYTAGQMVRYYVTAADTKYSSRYPLFINPSSSPEYQGTVVQDAVASSLPVLYWFVQDPEAAGTDTGTQASLFYDGVFYDNVHVRLRGQSSAWWPKKHYKFDMCAGFYFRYRPNEEPVEEFNLQSSYSDKSYIRQVLSWDVYARAGVPGLVSFPMRVQQNNTFFSVASFLEQPDTTMLTRNGLDADGALYKMYNECTSSTWDVEKKTRETEDNSDLQQLVTGVALRGTSLRNYLCDNVDIPEVINYLAATSIMHDNDHMSKNYYVYRDTDGNGEWQMLPWDKDLTWGRNFVPWDGGVLADEIWANDDPYSHPLFGDAAHTKVDGWWNRFVDAMYRDTTIRSMYLRRLRTLMDTLLQDPTVPYSERYLEGRVDALQAQIAADVALDRARWGNPYGANQDLVFAVGVLKNLYLVPRRSHLFQTHAAAGGLIPAAQAGWPAVRFGGTAPESLQASPDEAYVVLANPTGQVVDISGWSLSGDIQHVFRPGTVMPVGGTLYVARNARAFRNRAVAPRGGMGLFVQGNYKGSQVESGADIRLLAPDGTIVTRLAPVMSDVLDALRVSAGMAAGSAPAHARLNVVTEGESATRVDLSDAARLARQVAGLDSVSP